jgi:hypothetical protein
MIFVSLYNCNRMKKLKTETKLKVCNKYVCTHII